MKPLLLTVLMLNVSLGGWTMNTADIPLKAAEDAIMATTPEILSVHDWVLATFARTQPESWNNRVQLEVRRQDHNTLHFRQSCLETPLKIGTKDFQRGLGTHANSEIAVQIPPKARSFKAFVGIDNNYDTMGSRGTARFSVKLDGNQVFHTEILKGGDEPKDVFLDLPANSRELVLIVDDAEDGQGFDQADWADASFTLEDGKILWLDEGHDHDLLFQTSLPFSFRYGGVSSAEFIGSWRHTSKRKELGDRTLHEATWTDSETGLVVTLIVTTFTRYPAIDWYMTIQNTGKEKTPVLEDIQVADVTLDTGNSKRPVVIHQLQGDSCSEKSFEPFVTNLGIGEQTKIAPTRGRPSQETAFPFWNLQYGEQGIITAIGWSGQWAASYQRAPQATTRFRAGMEHTNLTLYPGEKIRTPRVLFLPWKVDRTAAHNRFRRLMLHEYIPKLEGRPLRLPVALQPFDRYVGRPDWATEKGQIHAADVAKDLGCDTYWFDAAWFVGGFPNGVGNWFCKPLEFPNGLKPVSDRCHANGLKFLVWFEPCRVAEGTAIAKEHPEFVLGGEKGGLFNLGDPKARAWMTDLISQRLTEFGIDVYREDYNIDPLGFWRGNDAPDRQGMTEIRFVEGHYAFWDELLSRHPGLWIDNCASGGRRIDLETCMRSVPLWRSDTNCWTGNLEYKQFQSASLSQYIPLHTACAWTPGRYEIRSAATGGCLVDFDYLDPNFSIDNARVVLDEVKETQRYWYGDFYPLTPIRKGNDSFMAYQFHRADLEEGIALAFRQPECPLKGIILEPSAIKSSASYLFEFIDEAGGKTSQEINGKEIESQGLAIRIAKPGESLLIRYRIKRP